MNSKSPRISLSIGRATDGPRTVGDVNPLGMSFAIYLIWLFMAVLNPSLAAGVPFLDYAAESSSSHSTLLYSFFAASTAALILIGVLDSKIDRSSFVPASIVGAVLLCVVGTLGSILSAFMGVWLVALSGVMMGVGSSFFIISWGAIYTRFGFATTVLNSSLSYCIAYIVAILLVSAIPTQAGAIITLLLPFACIPAMISANKSAAVHIARKANCRHTSYAGKTNGSSSSEDEQIGTYAARCWLTMALLGVVIGALRAICCEEMLWEGSAAIGLMLCGGAMVSILIMLIALVMSRKEGSWDHLFRTLMPVIIAGIALIAIPSEGGMVSVFCIALAFICAESLVWIFLANVTKDLGMSVIKMFGIGFGLAQLGSIAGIWLLNTVISLGGADGVGTPITLASAASGLAASNVGHAGMLEFQYQVALLALALIVVAAFANAALPRYYELKSMMSGLLSSLMPTSAMLSCQECSKADSCEAVRSEANVTNAQTPSTSEKPLNAPNASSQGGEERAMNSQAEQGPQSAQRQEQVPTANDAETQTAPATAGTSANVASGAGANAATNANAESSPIASAAEPSSTPAVASEPEKHDTKGGFKRRCDEISDACSLSGREREVLQLLARGHNAAFIMDELCISKSTVKTHINHIYKKLDIHTQQELLSMMEDRDRGPSAEH